MKNKIKFRKGSLSLNKETLSKINEQQMKAIAGGLAHAAATIEVPPTKGDMMAAASDCCSMANTACCG